MPTPPSTNRVSFWEWTQAALLAVNLAWTTLCLGGYRPETMVVTGTLTCALLAVHLLSRAFGSQPRTHPAGWLLLPFLVYAAMNVRWITPVPWLGWRDWMEWAQMIAVFWVVLNGVRSPAPRVALFAVLVALGLVAVALAGYQHYVRPDWMMLGRVQAEQFLTRSSGCFGIPNSLAAFLLLLIPPLGALAFRAEASGLARWVCGAAGALLIFGLILTISRGAWLGLALALGVWPLLAARGHWRKRLLAASGSLVTVVALGGALYALSPTIRVRLIGFVRDRGEVTRPIMWRGAWQMFRTQPALGTGAASYNVLFDKFRPEGFHDEPQWAHNDYLNTLSDYGLVGFGLFFGVAAAIAWRCARGPRDAGDVAPGWLDSPAMVAAFAIGLLAFALQLFVDFHFKIPALAFAFAVCAAFVVQRRWPAGAAREPRPVARFICVILAADAVCGAWFFVVPVFKAEALRYGARQRIDRLADVSVESPEYRARLAESRTGFVQAVLIDPANAQAWSDLAYATALWGHLFPNQAARLGVGAEASASRALTLSPACAEFWIRRGVARDMRGKWFEASLDFVQATTLAPNTGWVWFYYADHMSQKVSERGLTDAALALCLRLDPQNRDGLALRQHLAISHKASP